MLSGQHHSPYSRNETLTCRNKPRMNAQPKPSACRDSRIQTLFHHSKNTLYIPSPCVCPSPVIIKIILCGVFPVDIMHGNVMAVFVFHARIAVKQEAIDFFIDLIDLFISILVRPLIKSSSAPSRMAFFLVISSVRFAMCVSNIARVSAMACCSWSGGRGISISAIIGLRTESTGDIAEIVDDIHTLMSRKFAVDVMKYLPRITIPSSQYSLAIIISNINTLYSLRPHEKFISSICAFPEFLGA